MARILEFTKESPFDKRFKVSVFVDKVETVEENEIGGTRIHTSANYVDVDQSYDEVMEAIKNK